MLPYALASSLLMALAPGLFVMVKFFSQDQMWLAQMTSILTRFLPEELLLPTLAYLQEESSLRQPLLVFLAVTLWGISKIPAHFLMMEKKRCQSHIPNGILRWISLWITLKMSALLSGVAVFVRFFQLNGLFASELFLMTGLIWFYQSISLTKNHLKDEIIGALISFVLLNGIGTFFFFYIHEIASTHSIYGPMSSLVIVLLSCFAVSNVLFLGYIIIEALNDGKPIVFHYPAMEKLGEKLWRCRLKKQESMEKESDI